MHSSLGTQNSLAANSQSLISLNIETTKKRRMSQSLLTFSTGQKHDYPILEYKEKFKNNFIQMKNSLSNINANITNYKHEIVKLEDFLITINEHERNYKSLTKKYSYVRKVIEESIEIENLISKLSSNQQIINISEYVNLHAKVREIIQYFKDSNLKEHKDYEQNMIKLMWRGFKVYEETFYVLLKRYDSVESFNSSSENEKLNLLNKITSLAECLQDEDISYNFTSKLIQGRRDKILSKLDDLKVQISKNLNEDNYEKNDGLLTNYFIESEKLFSVEHDYIYKILRPCRENIKDLVYSEITLLPLEKILQNMKELVTKHGKSNIKKFDFYQNFDVLNIWLEKTNEAYQKLVKPLNADIYQNICACIKLIESFCIKYIEDVFKDILQLNDKLENENVLKSCNDLIFFLSHLLLFDDAFNFTKKEFLLSGNNFSIENTISNLIKKMESKSLILEKKYSPLKYIFLINNVFFIQSKLYQKPFNKYVSNTFADSLNEVIKGYIKFYLDSTWAKVNEISFNEKDNRNVLIFENDGTTLKSSTKELIKKKFATFNEVMKINLKFQQNMQIIDSGIEKKLIESNIDYIATKYEGFYNVLADSGFTKFNNKYVLYQSANDVIQDLKLYFMPDVKRK